MSWIEDLEAIIADLDNATDGLGALKTLIDAIPTTMVGTNNAALASSWTSALATALGNYTGTRAGYIDELAAANLPTDIAALNTLLSDGTYGLAALETLVDGIETSQARQLFSMDFWSDPQEELAITDVAGDKALPDVTVADLPAGATIVRAIAMFKFRMVENTNVAANKTLLAQHIQVRDDTPGTFRDAIGIPDDSFTIAASTREGGDVLMGDHDIAVEVDGNDTYNFQWTAADADVDGINFNDVQCGLRILYSV